MASVMKQPEPHAFMEQELKRALSEESFGISKYEIMSTSPMKATARIVLLEGDAVMVCLTSRGFQLQSLSEPPMDPDLDAEVVFETIEQLLQSVSPRYETARRNALLAKLDTMISRE